MTTSTSSRSHNQVACDGVRTSWQATLPVKQHNVTFSVQRSMDGVVRAQKGVVRTPIDLRKEIHTGTVVLNKWIGTANAVRLPRLQVGV